MIFKANVPYRHKATKTIITPLKDVNVMSKWLFDQYEEVPREKQEPRVEDYSYDAKKQIERATGISE
jgi:hypothetical protein